MIKIFGSFCILEFSWVGCIMAQKFGGCWLLEWLKNDQVFGIFCILELSWVG
jgi:hypothetical protein